MTQDHSGHDYSGHDHSGHDHHHDGGHVHAPKDFGRAFLIGIVLNTGFVIVEAGFGFFGNSVALLADAGHNLSDVLGLVVAWVAASLSRRAPSARYTYGLRNSSVLAALANAMFLLIAVGAIAWEAIHRLLNPEPVAGVIMMAVAAAGILVNGGTALLFASGRKGDLNIRGAYLHMAADAAVSAGVVVAGGLVLMTGWLWLDPLVSVLIVVIIMASTWGLLRDSLSMSMAAVPPGIDPDLVRSFLLGRPGVVALHDLHIWPIGTTEVALTCHTVMQDGHPGDEALHAIARDLRARFGIGHATIQVETGAECAACPLVADGVV